MIDTKEVREILKKTYFPRILCVQVCDSHDELDRKLKIAEKTLRVVFDQLDCCCDEVDECPDEGLVCGECLARETLKQIRGSND